MPRLILIAGGTASGKSTIAASLKERLAGFSVAVFSHDHYYRDLSHLTKKEHEEYNFDHPDAIESGNLIEDLKLLLGGRPVDIPVYDYATYTRSGITYHVPASEIIIIEGIFALYYRDLNAMADLKIFVDSPPDIRLQRRIERDTADRGYSRDEIIERYQKTVKPMHDIYIEPARKIADIIVSGIDNVDNICDKIMNRLQNILK